MTLVVLLDRDGTVIIDRHYLAEPDDVSLERGAARGLRRLADAGALLIVVTNQSGVGRGMFDLNAVHAVNARVSELLAAEGVSLAGYYICPHDAAAACACRKPEPGLVQQAVSDFGFDPTYAFVVGDKLSDVELARAVGATGILVESGKGAMLADAARKAGFAVAADLDGAADLILGWCVTELGAADA